MSIGSWDLGFSMTPVLAVSQGASFGPRVATVTFNMARYDGPRWSTKIVVDLDGATYQDESAVRRRGGRAAVPVGRRAAKAISSGALIPTVELRSRNPAWAIAVWQHEEEFEGYPRFVVATHDFRCDGQREDDLRPAPELAQALARSLLLIADRLHAAIDDPKYLHLFGGR